jgi:hypothetical protein
LQQGRIRQEYSTDKGVEIEHKEDSRMSNVERPEKRLLRLIGNLSVAWAERNDWVLARAAMGLSTASTWAIYGVYDEVNFLEACMLPGAKHPVYQDYSGII